jgi:hypothetical protein
MVYGQDLVGCPPKPTKVLTEVDHQSLSAVRPDFASRVKLFEQACSLGCRMAARVGVAPVLIVGKAPRPLAHFRWAEGGPDLGRSAVDPAAGMAKILRTRVWVLRRPPASPAASLEVDVTSKFALDGGHVDVEFVEHAPSARPRVEDQGCEEVFGAQTGVLVERLSDREGGSSLSGELRMIDDHLL